MSKLSGKARAKKRKNKRLKSQQQREGYRKKYLNKILKWDNPILSEKCSTVEKDENIKDVIKDMGRILSFSKNGVGLSASQIGITKRIVAVLINKKIVFFINPEIKIHDGDIIKSREGCLSYPGVEATIERNSKVTVEYEDESRVIHQKEFVGFEAIVLQHEIDHTLGICQVGDEWKRMSTPAPVGEEKEEVEEEYEDPVPVVSNSSESS